MKIKLLVLSLYCILGVTGCSKVLESNSENTHQQNAESVTTAEEQYLTLADQFFQEQLALEPIHATYVGVNQYNDQYGESLSEQYLHKQHQLNSQYLVLAKKIDTIKLPKELQLSHQMFIYDRELALVAETFPMRFIPMNQFYNPIITMVQLGTGSSAQPFYTVQDYHNWIGRVDGFIRWLDRAKARMNEGIESKVVLPRVLVEKLLSQIDAQQVENIENSTFYQPINLFPNDFSEQDKVQLTEQYKQMISQRLLPALSQLSQFIEQDYLPKARATDGWWGLPNGKLWYQHLANSHTTTQMPVEQIHQLGLEEVARILSEMDNVRQQVGFEGDLQAFFTELSSNPNYFFKDKQDLIDGYSSIKTTINQKLPEYFNVQPKADYEVRAVEQFRERSAAGASYQAPAVDGSRPGIFYVNTYNLKAQPKWGMTTLSLHEAAPGHHFQIAIKQELQGIPQFQRFGGYTAFEEGWGLYAEYLGIEMGLFNDPYQYFGKLSDEMLRAMRLVVDTGLHHHGWSREQAIQYMQDNSPMAESDVIAEVERYMALPGQALSYKVGQLQILALRDKAEKALGDKFDIKAFHDQILTTGSLPMAVMEAKINLWIEQNAA
ncbi:DUF885 domain-containing protein [Shewanella marina]|uniref:DUF885 domain-containing protein n=1 Tax=Shewanella marina TaxID=487319 RepID=UPI0004718A26|nr:DUF885 domain-containing protein [Shewanella marina]